MAASAIPQTGIGIPRDVIVARVTKSVAIIAVAIAFVAACNKPRRPKDGARDENVDFARPTYAIKTHEGTTEVLHLYKQASERLRQGDPEGARAFYGAAIRAEPNNPAAHVGLAGCALEEGELEAARAYYRQALALDANWVSAHVGLGTVASLQKLNQEALAEYETAIRLDAKDADAHWGAAVVCDELGARDKLRTYAARFLELAPDSALAPRARQLLGR